MKKLRLLFPVALVCSFWAQHAAAANLLFSDLAPASSKYTNGGMVVQGSNSFPSQPSVTEASLFAVAGSGSEAVSQIDLGVFYVNMPSGFYASIWSDKAGVPGVQLPGAYWTATTNAVFFVSTACCAPVSITGISGVTLNGGASYFMVLGPLSLTDTSSNAWAYNVVGATSDRQYSQNGGAIWFDSGPTENTGAFDILGTVITPEPSSVILFAAGLALIVSLHNIRYRKLFASVVLLSLLTKSVLCRSRHASQAAEKVLVNT